MCEDRFLPGSCEHAHPEDAKDWSILRREHAAVEVKKEVLKACKSFARFVLFFPKLCKSCIICSIAELMLSEENGRMRRFVTQAG